MDADWRDHVPVWLRLSEKPFILGASNGRGRGHTKFSEAQAQEILRRVEAGEKINAIAVELGAGRQTVANTVRRARRG